MSLSTNSYQSEKERDSLNELKGILLTDYSVNLEEEELKSFRNQFLLLVKTLVDQPHDNNSSRKG